MPAISQLPAAGSLTGAELLALVQNGQTVQAPLITVLNGITVDANGVQDRLRIQNAINLLNSQGGGTLWLGPGTFQLDGTPIQPKDKVSIIGCGMGVTILQQTVLAVRAFDSLGVSTNYVSFQNFTVNGLWQSNQSLGNDNDRCFAVNNVDRLFFLNVEATNSRQMSITAGFCGEIIAIGNRVKFSARDCLNFTGSRRCIVMANSIRNGNDDAIAIHQTLAAGNPPAEGHIVVGNDIEDCYGIKLLGAAKAQISNNICKRVKGYGIYTVPSTIEGVSDQVQVEITNNIVDTIINPTLFGGTSNIAVGIFLGNDVTNFKLPVVPGSPPTITLPETLYYISNATGASNAGMQNCNVSNNTVFGSTFPAAQYSSWGYGSLFTSTGMVDPNLTTNFKFSSLGMRINGATLTLNLSQNHFENLAHCVQIDAGTPYMAQMKIQGNTFRRFRGYALSSETGSVLYGQQIVEGNTFDGDPYFESANRTQPLDGSWSTATFQPAAFDQVGFFGAVNRNNHFKNLNRVSHFNSAAASYEGNTYYMQPGPSMTLSTSDSTSKGIWAADGFQHPTDRLIWIDSNPTSATYGQELGRSSGASFALPTTGYWVTGQFVKCLDPTQQAGPPAYVLLGWTRLTTGNANVLNTDWRELRCPTGN